MPQNTNRKLPIYPFAAHSRVLENPRRTPYVTSKPPPFSLRQLHSMPTIKFVNEKKTVEVEPGTNLRRAAMKEGINLYPGVHKYVNCMGFGSCASCRVRITKGTENVSRQSLREWARLLLGPITFFARLGNEKTLRLACQTRVNGDIEVETQPAVNWHGEKYWG